MITAMENVPFEDIFSIENGDNPASYLIVYQRVDIKSYLQELPAMN